MSCPGKPFKQYRRNPLSRSRWLRAVAVAAVLLAQPLTAVAADQDLQRQLALVEQRLAQLHASVSAPQSIVDPDAVRRQLANARFAVLALPGDAGEPRRLQQTLLERLAAVRADMLAAEGDAIATSGKGLQRTRDTLLASLDDARAYALRFESGETTTWSARAYETWMRLGTDNRVVVLAATLIAALSYLLAFRWWRRRRTRSGLEAGRRLQRTLDALPDAVALFNRKGQLTTINRKLLKMLPIDLPSTALKGATSSDLFAQLSPDNLAIEKARTRAIETATDPDATLCFEVPSYNSDALLVKERLTDDGGTAISVYGAFRQQARLSDPLTALPTRARLLNELAQRCSRTADHLALIIVDLRSFRQINDSYGRKAGDELLKQTAICLQHCMPDDALIARVAGDEFAVLIEFDGDTRLIEKRIGVFLSTLRRGLMVNTLNVPVRASVGIAYAPQHGNTVSSLLKCADSACAHAKRLGNNTWVVYDTEQQQAAKRRHQLEIGLQQAIEKDELFLQYQPQIDIRTKMTCGMEALLRWESAEHGRVSPGEFIGIAEQTGIITRLGHWVLEKSLEDYKRLARYGMSPATLSVNLSRRQFENHGIVKDVAHLLEKNRIDPANLCLEITETALFRDSSAMRKILHELSSLGTRIAIDDFGVGYSSLLELRDFPIGEVKIDRAFVSDIATNANSQDIIRAVVDIAGSIGALVVAEGIENQEQYDAVAALGCDRAQGYFLCMPMSATTFPDVVLSA